MTREQFNKIIQKGFDERKFNNLMGIQLLLLRIAEHYNQEAIDYTAKFGLQTLNNKHDFNNLDKQIRRVGDKIGSAMSANLENKMNFADDFEEFLKYTDEFIK